MISLSQASNNIWTDTILAQFTDDKVYVVQTNTKVIERCLLMTTDPGDLVPRPDLRQRHHRLRRGAVGPALDHVRHVARGPRPGAHPAHGRQVPLLPAGRFAGRREEGDGAQRTIQRIWRGDASRCDCDDDGGHPQGLRLQARARTSPSSPSPTTRRSTPSTRAGRSSLNRCASRSTRLLGKDWEEWQVPREAAARPGRSARTCKSLRCTRMVAGRVATARPRSTRPSRAAPRPKPSTTSPTRTTSGCASPVRSPWKACRRTGCLSTDDPSTGSGQGSTISEREARKGQDFAPVGSPP